MSELTFATTGFERFTKTTKRAAFLSEMDRIIPWPKLCAVVAKHYPKGEGGRPTVGLERMLRIHFLQVWFNLSDPGVEEALYDSNAMRGFVGIDLGRERVPDETTICRFRHLLERHHLGKRLFKKLNAHLKASGIVTVGPGTIVDATIIHAPSSTKNERQERDPEMHQTKKGGQWYFGCKVHIGVQSTNSVVHSLEMTAANVHDSQVLEKVLHGKETRVYGDSAYMGQKAAIRKRSPRAKDFTNVRARRNRPLTDAEREVNRTKSKVRAKVEHPFNVVKRLWGNAKVRYRGLAKNLNRYFVAFALSNIYLCRNKLLRMSRA